MSMEIIPNELENIRAEQTRCGDWLREHATWRDSPVEAERNAYRCALLGAGDWVMEEVLVLRAEPAPGHAEVPS